MKGFLKEAIWFIVAGLIIWCIFNLKQCGCNRDALPTDTVLTSTTYVYDTITHQVNVPKPEVVYSVVRIPIPVDCTKIIHIDTEAIIRNYYTVHYYNQVIQDSNIIATIEDTLFKNEITWRNFTYRLLNPTQINEYTSITQAKPITKVYAGIGVQAGFSGNLPALGPELFIADKKNHLFKVGYMFGSQPGVTAGMYFKIGKP